MARGSTPAQIQADILSTYFAHLSKVGYMDDIRTSQLLTAVLLLDTISFFKDYVDDAYIRKVEKYLQKSKCCNCAIAYDKIVPTECKTCNPEDIINVKLRIGGPSSSSFYTGTLEYLGGIEDLYTYLCSNDAARNMFAEGDPSPSNVYVMADRNDFSLVTNLDEIFFFVGGTKEEPELIGDPNYTCIIAAVSPTLEVGTPVYHANPILWNTISYSPITNQIYKATYNSIYGTIVEVSET